MSYERRTKDAARGQWKSILTAIGMDASFLTGRNGPCPCCGGTDRWQWVNDAGLGGGVCRQCGGKADGIHLVAQWRGIEWREAADEVDRVLGNERVSTDPVRQETTPEQRKALCRKVVAQTRPVQPGDEVDRYLASRGLSQTTYPKALRFAPSLRHSDGRDYPAMVAVVTGQDGVNETLHRTFLDNGHKLDAPNARKMMPGRIPDGCAVRLCELGSQDDVLGVAEGIETALAASALFTVPVWAALNTSMLRNWEPPGQITEVVIFADNDAAFGGHAAAYALAHKLKTRPQWKHLAVSVQVPRLPGTDFADEWLARRQA